MKRLRSCVRRNWSTIARVTPDEHVPASRCCATEARSANMPPQRNGHG